MKIAYLPSILFLQCLLIQARTSIAREIGEPQPPALAESEAMMKAVTVENTGMTTEVTTRPTTRPTTKASVPRNPTWAIIGGLAGGLGFLGLLCFIAGLCLCLQSPQARDSSRANMANDQDNYPLRDINYR